MFKILNYFFLLLFLFVSKQIIFKSDIYVLKIIENKKTNADHMLYKFSKDENLANLYDQ